MKYYVDKNVELTPYEIRTYVENFKSSEELKRLKMLDDYYHGKNHGIMNRVSSNEINNQIISGFPRYISTMNTGYFTGNSDSITYNFPNDNEDVKENFAYNDEPSVTTSLALNMSIYGYAVEQYYVDNAGEFRFKCINPMNVVLLFEDNIEEDLCGVIKFREYPFKDKDGKELTKQVLEYYTANVYREYVFFDEAYQSDLTNDENSVNLFSDVPFTYYENPDRMGDFENVITLIDSYDRVLSDNNDLFDYFADAYLVFKGVQHPEDIKLKEMKGLNIGPDEDVFYLAKPQVSDDIINFTDTLKRDIHKFSFTVDLTDPDYLSAQSGVAQKLKLQGLEFLTSLKESKMKKGLTRRLELLANFKSLSNSNFEYTKSVIIFKRNTIEILSEILDSVIKLKGIISDETLLSRIPDIEVDTELKRLKKQKEQAIIDFNVPNPNNPNDFYNKQPKVEEEVEEDESAE